MTGLARAGGAAPSVRIPFNRPAVVGREREYIDEVLARAHLSGDGHFTRRCHALLSAAHGNAPTLLTTSCTHALEMAALLLDIAPDDEVILPTFTFVSTANAFVLRGAKPVFIDIRPDTLNLDDAHLEHLITSRTRAIVPVHYAGVGCEMDDVMAVAARHGVSVVEDNAHGLFGTYRGRPLGTFGRMSTLSFHETKNFTSGEGGALIVNDATLLERAEMIREKGTNRAQFFRGQVDKYTWVELGSSYLPSELLAAVLLGQLEARERVMTARRAVFQRYAEGLSDWAAALGARLPVVPAHCESAYHMFYILLPSLSSRTRLIEFLRARGIAALFHYVPLHTSTMGRHFGGAPGQCPVAEDVSDRLLRLPFYTGLSSDDQQQVIEAIHRFQ